ncbi:serine/threonine protein kinase [Metabacillus endolithicus]|uniref:Serine/threonine protein kinase n=1 Tax=Metabacillus endolithicus TaxID=1535204 RepID=A0ABW5BXP2_9BACI|nr:serine/threonine protein kinase [Metabacillus endolithicus]UPG64154.1 serine/threonine protein kinase [Metabacillus endolithicus]
MSWIDEQLMKHIFVYSKDPFDPVIVNNIPNGWKLIGKGNFAAVFTHPSLDGKVVKVYAENREGITEEIMVYKKLGEHNAYSRLYEYGERYLVLKKLEGITLYQAFSTGTFIQKTVIEDVDKAIHFAKSKGLNPTDIHGKNITMKDGKGYIVDVSDFLKTYSCPKWKHFKRGYYLIYLPLFKNIRIPFPHWLLERIRKSYQFYLLVTGFRRKQELYSNKNRSNLS